MISADSNFKDLHRFMTKELKPRMKGVKKEITKSISDTAIEGIQSRAPTDLGGYEKDLTNNHVKGNEDKVVGYAILYKGKPPVKGDKLDRATTLLFIRTAKRKVGKWASVFRALQDFGPFTLDTWPVKVPKDLAFVVYRQVNEREVNTVRDRNQREMNELIQVFQNLNIRLSRKDFNVNVEKMDFTEDMTFKVARREKGIGGVGAAPHWKPGIEESRTDNSLNKIFADPKIMKTLSDPNFRGWKDLGKIKLQVDPSKLEEIEKFQKLIIGA